MRRTANSLLDASARAANWVKATVIYSELADMILMYIVGTVVAFFIVRTCNSKSMKQQRAGERGIIVEKSRSICI